MGFGLGGLGLGGGFFLGSFRFLFFVVVRVVGRRGIFLAVGFRLGRLLGARRLLVVALGRALGQQRHRLVARQLFRLEVARHGGTGPAMLYIVCGAAVIVFD